MGGQLLALEWPDFLGDLPSWVGLTVTLAGGTFVGGYGAARARVRLDDRRALRDRILLQLQIPGSAVPPTDSQWSQANNPNPSAMGPNIHFLAQMHMLDLLSEANRTFEVLGWRERALWRQNVRQLPEDFRNFAREAFANRRSALVESSIKREMLTLPTYHMAEDGPEMQRWLGAVLYLNRLLLAQIRSGAGPRWVIFKATWKLLWSPIELARSLLIPWPWTDDEPFTRRHPPTVTAFAWAKIRRRWALSVKRISTTFAQGRT